MATTSSKDQSPPRKPKRPLSAYNYFYKSERARLLGLDIEEYLNKERENTVEERKARKHRKTPGMIGFKGLSRHVGDAWLKLASEEKEKFERMFQKDQKRYRREMGEWRKHYIDEKASHARDSAGRNKLGPSFDCVDSEIIQETRFFSLETCEGDLSQSCDKCKEGSLSYQLEPIPISCMSQTLAEVEQQILKLCSPRARE